MDINVTCYINSLGYGVAGLNIVKALVRNGHSPALWVNGQGQSSREDQAVIEAALGRSRSYNPKAPSLRIAHQWDMAHRIGLGPHLGLSFFELNRLTPTEVHNLRNLDVALATSEWAAGVMKDSGVPDEKIFYAPLGVDRDIFHPRVPGTLPGATPEFVKKVDIDNTTVFLSCGKWEVRKGHDVLVDAFSRAFVADDNVLLVMNCNNPFLTADQQDQWKMLYQTSPMGHRVIVLNSRLPQQQDVAALMAFADCGVFPARAEGWNLEALEMLAMGKQVIATDYAAHTEFLDRENAKLIAIDGLEIAYDDVFFKNGFGEWAELGEAQIDQLVEYMRDVHRQKQAGELRPNEAGVATAALLTWDNTVAEIMGAI